MVVGFFFFFVRLLTNDKSRKERCRIINCYSVNQSLLRLPFIAVYPCSWQMSLVLYCLSDAYYAMQRNDKHLRRRNLGTEPRINRMEFLRDTTSLYHQRNDTSRDSAKKKRTHIKIRGESRRLFPKITLTHF